MYLQTRKLLAFEVLMLEKLGGRQILEDLCGKKLPKKLTALQTEVYHWTDTSKKYPFRHDDYLKATEAEFDEIYAEERAMQLRAMDNDEQRVRSSIFATELEQIWIAINTKINDQKESATDIEVKGDAVLTELARCLPDHYLSYMFFINMNMMESVEPSPRASSAKSEVELLEEQLESMQIHNSQID